MSDHSAEHHDDAHEDAAHDVHSEHGHGPQLQTAPGLILVIVAIVFAWLVYVLKPFEEAPITLTCGNGYVRLPMQKELTIALPASAKPCMTNWAMRPEDAPAFWVKNDQPVTIHYFFVDAEKVALENVNPMIEKSFEKKIKGVRFLLGEEEKTIHIQLR